MRTSYFVSDEPSQPVLSVEPSIVDIEILRTPKPYGSEVRVQTDPVVIRPKAHDCGMGLEKKHF